MRQGGGREPTPLALFLPPRLSVEYYAYRLQYALFAMVMVL